MPSKNTTRARKGAQHTPTPRPRLNAQGKVTSYEMWLPTRRVNGVVIREKARGKTAELARQAYLQWFIDNPDPTAAPVGNQSLVAYGEWWLEEIIKPPVGKAWATYVNYRGAFDRHIKPDWACGKMNLAGGKAEQRVNLENLEAWDRRMVKAGLGKQTRILAIKVMRALCASAARNTSRSGVSVSPARHLAYPPLPKRGKVKIAPAAIKTLANAFADMPHLAALPTVATGLGLRRGELCALRYGDFEQQPGMVLIGRQVQQLGMGIGITEKDPKFVREGSEAKAVHVAPWIVDAVREQRKAALELFMADQKAWLKHGPDPRDPQAFVFTENGGYIKPSRLYYIYRKLREASGVSLTMHGMRHAYATVHVAMGTPPDLIAAGMRHGDPSTVFKYYIDELDRPNDAAANMDAFFRQLNAAPVEQSA